MIEIIMPVAILFVSAFGSVFMMLINGKIKGNAEALKSGLQRIEEVLNDKIQSEKEARLTQNKNCENAIVERGRRRDDQNQRFNELISTQQKLTDKLIKDVDGLKESRVETNTRLDNIDQAIHEILTILRDERQNNTNTRMLQR